MVRDSRNVTLCHLEVTFKLMNFVKMVPEMSFKNVALNVFGHQQ